jgi:hypothetical protein
MKAWFLSRDRRPFRWPAVAATLLHPLFWVMLLGPDPKRGAPGFGGVQALEVFAAFLGLAAVLPLIGWTFASRSVFAVMAIGGVFAWPVWAMFVVKGLPAGVAMWPELTTMDRIIGIVLTIQLLLWPLCFALLFRAAMGRSERAGMWRDRLAALRPRNLLARDRRRFGAPALAAALCNPLPWVLHLGPDPKRGTTGFGGWGTLDDFAILLLAGAVPALLGWILASWTVFGLLAWGSVLVWGAWLLMMHRAWLLLTGEWATLPVADQGMALILVTQALPYPLAFWLVLRVAMGWDRRA